MYLYKIHTKILIVYIFSPHPIHGDSSNATQDGKLLGQKYGVTTGLIQAIANSRGQRNAWGYLAETGQQWWVNSPAALLAFRKDMCLFVGHVSFYCFFHFFCRDFGYFWTCRGKSRPRLITYLSQSQSRPDSEFRQIIFERLHFSFTTKLAEILAVGIISMAMVKLAEIWPPSSRAGCSRKATLFLNGALHRLF